MLKWFTGFRHAHSIGESVCLGLPLPKRGGCANAFEKNSGKKSGSSLYSMQIINYFIM